jgi:hypothetical protein
MKRYTWDIINGSARKSGVFTHYTDSFTPYFGLRGSQERNQHDTGSKQRQAYSSTLKVEETFSSETSV